VNFVGLAIDLGAAWTFAAGQTIAAQSKAGRQRHADQQRQCVDRDPARLRRRPDQRERWDRQRHRAGFGAPWPRQRGDGRELWAARRRTGAYGVELLGGGSVTNRAGTIKSRTGVVINKAGTVTNIGSIVGSGGTAVLLSQGFQNRVAMSPGAVFTGKVDGGNTSAAGTAISTLELMTGTSAGTLSGIGSQYVHFRISWSIRVRHGPSPPARFSRQPIRSPTTAR